MEIEGQIGIQLVHIIGQAWVGGRLGKRVSIFIVDQTLNPKVKLEHARAGNRRPSWDKPSAYNTGKCGYVGVGPWPMESIWV